MLRKKLPPFSSLITSETKYIFVFIGHKAWQYARAWQKFAIALPPWLNPFDFTWPVNGRHIAVFDTGYAEEDYIEDLVRALFKNGAIEVLTLSPDYQPLVFKKDIPND